MPWDSIWDAAGCREIPSDFTPNCHRNPQCACVLSSNSTVIYTPRHRFKRELHDMEDAPFMLRVHLPAKDRGDGDPDVRVCGFGSRHGALR